MSLIINFAQQKLKEMGAAFFAKRMGRNPVKWFFIGLVLPVIASFILFFLPDLSEKELNDHIK